MGFACSGVLQKVLMTLQVLFVDSRRLLWSEEWNGHRDRIECESHTDTMTIDENGGPAGVEVKELLTDIFISCLLSSTTRHNTRNINLMQNRI